MKRFLLIAIVLSGCNDMLPASYQLEACQKACSPHPMQKMSTQDGCVCAISGAPSASAPPAEPK